MEEYIVFDDVHFSRGQRKIFNGMNLAVPKGKTTAIMGPSGTGKTTLLKLIGGLLMTMSSGPGLLSLDGSSSH